MAPCASSSTTSRSRTGFWPRRGRRRWKVWLISSSDLVLAILLTTLLCPAASDDEEGVVVGPCAVEDVTATAISPTSVELAWSKVGCQVVLKHKVYLRHLRHLACPQVRMRAKGYRAVCLSSR